MGPRRGRTISTDCRLLARSYVVSVVVRSWRWIRRASSPPMGASSMASRMVTRVRSMSPHDPTRVHQREVKGDGDRGGEKRGEQRLAHHDADGDAADRDRDDDRGGEVDPAGGDERDAELGERAFAEE